MSKDSMFKSALLPSLLAAAAALSACATPGRTAAEQGNAAALKQVLDQPNHGGEDIDWLIPTSYVSNCVECARVLFQAGAKAQASGSPWDLDHLLAYSAQNGHVKMAELFLDQGAETIAAMAIIRESGNGALVQTADEVFKKIEQDRQSRTAAPSADVSTSSTSAPAKSAPSGSATWWK